MLYKPIGDHIKCQKSAVSAHAAKIELTCGQNDDPRIFSNFRVLAVKDL